MRFEDSPVLVAEDREENRRAAAEFFASINVPVVFATCFQQAKNLMEAKNIFRACIFDVELPENDGDKPVPHHHEMQEVAQKTFNSAYIFLTGGCGHGFDGAYSTIMLRFLDLMHTEDMDNVFYFNTNVQWAKFHGKKDKTDPKTWKETWDHLNEIFEPESIRVMTEIKIEVWSTPAQE